MAKLNLNAQQHAKLCDRLQRGLDQAAASLQIMLGGNIQIQIVSPSMRIDSVNVRLGLVGALEGGFYIDLPENMAVEMVKTLTAGADLSLLDEEARSALMEFGNILASVFVAYFDQNSGLRTLPTPPEISLVPLDIPEFDSFFSAELRWNNSIEKTEILLGLQKSAVDILLA